MVSEQQNAPIQTGPKLELVVASSQHLLVTWAIGLVTNLKENVQKYAK